MAVWLWPGPGLAETVPDLQSPPVPGSRPQVPASPQTVPERPSLLQQISHYPDIFRLVCSHLDLTSILQLEVVCRDLRKMVVSERIFRDLVSAGIRSGQLSGGGWGWRRQRQSLLSSPSPLELSKHFKRKLIDHHCQYGL